MKPIAVAAGCEAYVYGPFIAGIAGSNPAGGWGWGIHISSVNFVCCAGRGPCEGPDPSSRGILPSVCVSMCVIT